MKILQLFLEADIVDDEVDINNDNPEKPLKKTDISFDQPIQKKVDPKLTLKKPEVSKEPIKVDAPIQKKPEPIKKPEKPQLKAHDDIKLKGQQEEPLGVIDGSSCIDDVDYVKSNRKLTITFNNGSRYEYYRVPYDVWAGFFSAPSKGSYFHQMVRGKFNYEKIN